MIKIDNALQLNDGDLISFVKDGERIGVYRKSKQHFFTFIDECTHDGASICDGHIENGNQIVCARHGAKFSLENGQVLQMPASSPLEVLPNKIVDEELYVELDN